MCYVSFRGGLGEGKGQGVYESLLQYLVIITQFRFQFITHDRHHLPIGQNPAKHLVIYIYICETLMKNGICPISPDSHSANGPWDKGLNFILPTKHVILARMFFQV